jgi:Flp pilus assembly protein TadG
MRRPVPSSLRANDRGASAVEFALIAPVFFAILFSAHELSHRLYVKSQLQGSLQKAARDMSLENASDVMRQNMIKQAVSDAVKKVVTSGTVTITTTSFYNYSKAQDPGEDFNDMNGNGVCDNGEPFVDYNKNGTRDADSSVQGRGGAKDVVVLTAKVEFPRLMLGHFFIATPLQTLTATTLLRNQPSDLQPDPPTGTCP